MSSDDVRRELAQEIAERQWTKLDLANAAGLDQGTIGDFLNGKTQRMQQVTRRRLEESLGWPAHRIDELMSRPAGPVTTVLLSDDRHLVALPRGWDDGLTPVQRAARLARAEAAFFEELGGAPSERSMPNDL